MASSRSAAPVGSSRRRRGALGQPGPRGRLGHREPIQDGRPWIRVPRLPRSSSRNPTTSRRGRHCSAVSGARRHLHPPPRKSVPAGAPPIGAAAAHPEAESPRGSPRAGRPGGASRGRTSLARTRAVKGRGHHTSSSSSTSSGWQSPTFSRSSCLDFSSGRSSPLGDHGCHLHSRQCVDREDLGLPVGSPAAGRGPLSPVSPRDRPGHRPALYGGPLGGQAQLAPPVGGRVLAVFVAFTVATALWLATIGVFFRGTSDIDILEVTLPMLFWATGASSRSLWRR